MYDKWNKIPHYIQTEITGRGPYEPPLNITCNEFYIKLFQTKLISSLLVHNMASFLVSCYMTLHLKLSILPSVGWAYLTSFYDFHSLMTLLLPKCSSDLKYGPCLPACDWGSRESGFVVKCLHVWPQVYFHDEVSQCKLAKTTILLTFLAFTLGIIIRQRKKQKRESKERWGLYV